MRRLLFILVMLGLGFAFTATQVSAHTHTVPKPPAFMPGTLHGKPAHAAWVQLGPDCELHAYLVTGNNTWAVASGAISCNQNERELQIEVCGQVWTGSGWATKQGSCAVSPIAYKAAGLGNGQGDPADSYTWQPSCAPNSHTYRTWDWGYNVDNAGNGHQVTYYSSGATVC